MMTIFKGLLTTMLLLCSSSLLADQNTDNEPGSEPEKTREMDGPTSRENPMSPVPYESGRVGESTCENRWSDFLPILGQALSLIHI